MKLYNPKYGCYVRKCKLSDIPIDSEFIWGVFKFVKISNHRIDRLSKSIPNCVNTSNKHLGVLSDRSTVYEVLK